jgi:hypothetical protein
MASLRNTEVELASYPQQPTIVASTDIEPLHDDASHHDDGFSLPPTDGGKDAWLCLLACFMLEALIWGELYEPVQKRCAHRVARLPSFLWYIPGVL